MILHTIVVDAPKRPSARKALLTGNANDFNDPQIVQLLNSVGVEEVINTAGDALKWIANAGSSNE